MLVEENVARGKEVVRLVFGKSGSVEWWLTVEYSSEAHWKELVLKLMAADVVVG